MHKSMIAMITLAGIMTMGAADGKLPPLSDEAKAKAAEEKNKVAWADKVAAYKLCLAQDRVAAYYKKTKKSSAPTAPENAGATATAPSVPTIAPAPAPTPTPAPTPAPAAAAPASGSSAMPATSSASPMPPAASATPLAIPPCQDPGPYASAQAGTKVGVADSLPVPAAGKPLSAGEAKK